ncbi:MAG: SpoIIE family protein phosphatase [Ignavibacteriaceae bacterium]|nr:SpoIIE family protein phosphatase [Ignavibacteriaceae bacterium]
MKTVREFMLRHQESILIVATIVLGFFALMAFIATVTFHRTSNDECLWINQKSPERGKMLVITQIKKGGVTDQGGIKDGDILLKINGNELESDLHAQGILNSMREGDSARYTISRGGVMMDKYIKIKKLVNYYNVSVTLLALIWLLVGFVVKMSKPDGLTQRLFYRIGAGYCVNVSVLLFNPFGSTLPTTFLAGMYVVLWVYVTNFIPSFILHFFSVFPTEFKFSKKKYFLFLVYGIPFVLSTIALVRGFFTFAETGIIDFRTPFNIVMNAGLPFSYIIALFFLILGLKYNKDKSRKKALVIILASYILGTLGIAFVTIVAPRIGDIIYNTPEYYTPIILMILLPLSFGYSIFRYNLMDVSDVVKNTVTYGFATILLAALYLGVVYGLGQAVGGVMPDEYRNISALVAFILFGVIFQSYREKIQESLTRRFYPEQHEARRILIEFSNNLSNIIGYKNIISSLESVFISTLKVKVFGICLMQQENFCNCESSTGFKFGFDRIDYHESSFQNFVADKKLRKAQIAIEGADFDSVFPNYAAKFRENGIFTIIPMMSNDQLLGFLLFGLKRSGSKFGGSDLDLLVAVSNQTSAAIENARLYAAEADRMNIEKELELARKIQQSLLPNNFPKIEGLEIFGQMRPAKQVGGDYFDVIHRDGNKLYVIVGDVSGKGLAASLYMTKIQTMLQFACESGESPVKILTDINPKIYQMLDKHSFITISLGLFDMNEKVLHYCRAGHLPLIVSENGRAFEVKGTGIALGIEHGKIFNSVINEEKIELKSEQVFLFYSDGITEAMNSSHEMFETEKLLSIVQENKKLPASEITGKIIAEVDNFRHGFQQNDDMTLVAVKVI